MTTPQDKIIDDLLMGTPENPKRVQKFCMKVIDRDALGQLTSKLQCDTREVVKVKGVRI